MIDIVPPGQAVSEEVNKSFEGYPSVATPPTCTATGFGDKGCGLSYDMSWLMDGRDLAMDIHVRPATHPHHCLGLAFARSS